jgi:D-3-phosphoglycerate dehydrogenase
MFNVSITDYNFRSLEPEESVLLPAGCSIRAQRILGETPLPELVGDADGVITQFAPVTAEVIQAMRKAKAIIRYGVGYDNVDLEAAAKKGIPVCNVPDYCVAEVADHALALILSITRQIPLISSRVRKGEWRFPIDLPRMRALNSMTAGILGFGRIGRAVAERLKGFGCQVIAYDPVSSASQIQASGVTPVSLDELYKRSDLISLHCPSSPETHRMINKEAFSKMKRGVILINVARGTIIQQDDLIAALREGQVAGAGLDVADPEPLPSDNPLLQMDQVVITNHVAAYSATSLDRLQRLAAETLLKALRGEPLPNVVNGVGRK